MNFSLLFVLMIVGVIFSVIQDIKRKEIDRWLTFSMLFSGVFFLTAKIIINKDSNLLLQSLFVFGIMFVLSQLLYYSKFFAGGDSSLLFSLSALFVGQTFLISILNILTFLVILFISGSGYGLVYTIVLYFKEFRKNNEDIKKIFKETKMKYVLLASIPFLILSYFFIYVIPIAVVMLLYPILFSVTKAVEKNSLTKTIEGKELREGDWLKDNIEINGKVIKSSFFGISKDEALELKNKKSIVIKEGIPFAPVFLISMILSLIFFEKIFTFLFQLFI